jgi:hypothetical protein
MFDVGCSMFDVFRQRTDGNRGASSEQPSGFPAQRQASRPGWLVVYFAVKPCPLDSVNLSGNPNPGRDMISRARAWRGIRQKTGLPVGIGKTIISNLCNFTGSTSASSSCI